MIYKKTEGLYYVSEAIQLSLIKNLKNYMSYPN